MVSTLIIVQNPSTGERRQNPNITPAAYIVSGLKSARGQRGRSLVVGSFHNCMPPRHSTSTLASAISYNLLAQRTSLTGYLS